MKKPGDYQQYIVNKFASRPDYLKKITNQYQEACARDGTG
jgi:hypothetical protein